MDLDTIEKRAKTATASELRINRFDEDGGKIRYQLQSIRGQHRVIGYFESPENGHAKQDAELFKHAREDILWLVGRVRDLELQLREEAARHETVRRLLRDAPAFFDETKSLVEQVGDALEGAA